MKHLCLCGGGAPGWALSCRRRGRPISRLPVFSIRSGPSSNRGNRESESHAHTSSRLQTGSDKLETRVCVCVTNELWRSERLMVWNSSHLSKTLHQHTVISPPSVWSHTSTHTHTLLSEWLCGVWPDRWVNKRNNTIQQCTISKRTILVCFRLWNNFCADVTKTACVYTVRHTVLLF